MNREFRASSRRRRSLLAVLAVVMTLLVIGSIDTLSRHYGAEAQLASTKTVVVAKR